MNNDSKKEQAMPQVSIARDEYDMLKATADKYLREHAELANARKRLLKEKEEFLRFATEDILNEILDVVDNFDRALEHMNTSQKTEVVLEGVKMIQKQFHTLLEQRGVERIKTIGEKFDPAAHDAIERLEADDDKDGIIVEELKAGYKFNGRLLRPAIVKVGKKIK